MNLDYLKWYFKRYFKRGVVPNLNPTPPPPNRKFITASSKDGKLLFESLRKLIEIPEGVRNLTLHIGIDEVVKVVKVEITYYPKFIGELDDD